MEGACPEEEAAFHLAFLVEVASLAVPLEGLVRVMGGHPPATLPFLPLELGTLATIPLQPPDTIRGTLLLTPENQVVSSLCYVHQLQLSSS